MRLSTKRTVYLAFLIALGVVLTRFASIRIAIMGVEGIRIGLGGFPIIFAGLLFGPVAGGVVGALTDIIGFLASPMGAYMPHFTLTAALTGMLPALVVKLARQQEPGFGLLVLAILVGQGITSVLLVPYFLHILFGLPYQAVLVPRIVAVVIQTPLYAGMVYVILHRLDALVQRVRLSYQ